MHIMHTSRVLTNKELRQIMDVLDCVKVICDSDVFTYYFYEKKTCLQ